MALPHAQPLDVIDLRPLGEALAGARSTSLLKTGHLQLMRVVLQAGQELPSHAVAGPLTLHCLEGRATVDTPTRSCELQAGELVMLEGQESHAVTTSTGTSLLVTLVLQRP
jgi:quercetin dioxygenase-like cupin family protein